MEVESILLGMMHCMNRLTRRVYRKHVAVVRTAVLLAIVFLCAMGVSGVSGNLISIEIGKETGLHAGTGEVLAAETIETDETEGLQAGLMGVVSGAMSMNAYSQAASEINTASANENILVGAARASRTERRRTNMEKSTQSARNVFKIGRAHV